MKVVLVLLAAAGVAGYIYRKELLTKVQKHIQLVVSELDEKDPILLKDIFQFRDLPLRSDDDA
jgi:hypothetical protein